ncbi:hypothetical protein BH09SUM1_BH09SUM1_10830 [soil metagenome]
MTSTLRTAAWTALIYLATATALSQVKYLNGDTSLFDPIFRPKYEAHLAVVLTHGISAVIVLLVGPWQFFPGFRARFPLWHRLAGRVYLLGVLVGAISGFRMGLMAYGGTAARVSFCLLATLWLATGGIALAMILRRNVAAHRRWMVRNFALTFAAVMLRVYLNLGQRAGLDYTVIYPVVTWMAWIPNIVAVELWMRLNNRGAQNRLKKLFTKLRSPQSNPDLQGSRSNA